MSPECTQAWMEYQRSRGAVGEASAAVFEAGWVAGTDKAYADGAEALRIVLHACAVSPATQDDVIARFLKAPR